jgi:hypothetical protein
METCAPESESATSAPAPEDDFATCRAALGARRRALHRGRIGVDGFHGGGFGTKLERERRYGEVFTLDEHEHGCLLRLELPRKVPDSAVKRSLGVGDDMPDPCCSATAEGNLLTVRGSITDAALRRVAAFSPAFPADFHTEVPLPSAGEWRVALRVADKVLEVVALRR